MLTVLTSEHFQPEKEYIFHVLFREMLGIEYVVEFAGERLAYSDSRTVRN
ncbi:MAG: hypothetical protein IPH31_05495 [Lewinellaceae bacterium]|nr:hypothetical protein [Lewinellaceae bacterium]